jgi:hypothetical protein
MKEAVCIKCGKQNIEIGDYVLATRYSDCDPHDPWCVGFVVEIIKNKKGIIYVIGEQFGKLLNTKKFRNAKKITAIEGQKWLAAYGRRI